MWSSPLNVHKEWNNYNNKNENKDHLNIKKSIQILDNSIKELIYIFQNNQKISNNIINLFQNIEDNLIYLISNFDSLDQSAIIQTIIQKNSKCFLTKLFNFIQKNSLLIFSNFKNIKEKLLIIFYGEYDEFLENTFFNEFEKLLPLINQLIINFQNLNFLFNNFEIQNNKTETEIKKLLEINLNFLEDIIYQGKLDFEKINLILSFILINLIDFKIYFPENIIHHYDNIIYQINNFSNISNLNQIIISLKKVLYNSNHSMNKKSIKINQSEIDKKFWGL